MIKFDDFIKKYDLIENSKIVLGEDITLKKNKNDNNIINICTSDYINLCIIKDNNGNAKVISCGNNNNNDNESREYLNDDPNTISFDEKDLIFNDLSDSLSTFGEIFYNKNSDEIIMSIFICTNDYQCIDYENKSCQIKLKNFNELMKVYNEIVKLDMSYYNNTNDIFNKNMNEEEISKILYKECLKIKENL